MREAAAAALSKEPITMPKDIYAVYTEACKKYPHLAECMHDYAGQPCHMTPRRWFAIVQKTGEALQTKGRLTPDDLTREIILYLKANYPQMVLDWVWILFTTPGQQRDIKAVGDAHNQLLRMVAPPPPQKLKQPTKLTKKKLNRHKKLRKKRALSVNQSKKQLNVLKMHIRNILFFLLYNGNQHIQSALVAMFQIMGIKEVTEAGSFGARFARVHSDLHASGFTSTRTAFMPEFKSDLRKGVDLWAYCMYKQMTKILGQPPLTMPPLKAIAPMTPGTTKAQAVFAVDVTNAFEGNFVDFIVAMLASPAGFISLYEKEQAFLLERLLELIRLENLRGIKYVTFMRDKEKLMYILTREAPTGSSYTLEISAMKPGRLTREAMSNLILRAGPSKNVTIPKGCPLRDWHALPHDIMKRAAQKMGDSDRVTIVEVRGVIEGFSLMIQPYLAVLQACHLSLTKGDPGANLAAGRSFSDRGGFSITPEEDGPQQLIRCWMIAVVWPQGLADTKKQAAIASLTKHGFTVASPKKHPASLEACSAVPPPPPQRSP